MKQDDKSLDPKIEQKWIKQTDPLNEMRDWEQGPQPPRESQTCRSSAHPYLPGDIIRMKYGHAWRVWKITGIHHGIMGQESLIQFIPLDKASGMNHQACFIPYEMLALHKSVELIEKGEIP